MTEERTWSRGVIYEAAGLLDQIRSEGRLVKSGQFVKIKPPGSLKSCIRGRRKTYLEC